MTAKRKPWKCRRAAWCSSMADRLNEQNAMGKGLAELVLMNLRTGRDDKPIGIYYKTKPGPMSTTALMINFCPWCGAPVFFGKKS